MRRIKFGVMVPQGWLNDLPQANAYKQFQLAKTVAVTAEKLGYTSVWVYDHFIPHYSYKPLETKPMFECFTLLAALAGITNRVMLGQVVSCSSYRPPSLLAKMGATLDAISNGRLELGIGAGWYKEEYVAYGYQFLKDSMRIEQLDEALHVIKSMWTEAKTTFFGKYYNVEGALCNPKPLQKPHPLIMVGGSGEKLLLRVAAKHADRYNHPFGTAEELKRKLDVLKEHCKSVRRDHREIEKSVLLRVIIANSDMEVSRIMRKVNSKYHMLDGYADRTNNKMIAGTPDRISADLNQYLQHGITHFILHLMDLNSEAKMLRLFASKVMKKI